MKEQEYTIENITSFEPKHIFECGQCFRWNRQLDGSYIGVIGNNVLQVKKESNQIVIISKGQDELEELVKQYFDLSTNYEQMKDKLGNVDSYMKQSINYGEGIRILKQDVWETIISFIISANNNIPRIKGIIEKMAKAYGNPIQWKGQVYYTFPTIEQLSKASVEELRALGLGFRDIRIYQTTQCFVTGQVTSQVLQQEKDTQKLREKLMELSGVGPKVADCILLFGLQRKEVFPIDVWVRRVMNELYLQQTDETKVKKTQIETLAKEKYADLAGLAQQYLFYWKRETA